MRANISIIENRRNREDTHKKKKYLFKALNQHNGKCVDNLHINWNIKSIHASCSKQNFS